MNLVVLADDAFTFLLAWEFMSLTSWALVMAHHRGARERARRLSSICVMASFGTLALLLAFGLLAGADGDYAFEAIRAAHPAARRSAALVLVLALLGAGSKAGLVPLHVWLPLAHPAAPSHVSALMSGVMTKVAVYGFVRIVFDLLGPPDWWWSMLVLGARRRHRGDGRALRADAARSQAAARLSHRREHRHHLHRPRPRAGLPGQRHAAAAALALTAALFHVFNHSLFKSLLFFGAGAVLDATGERDMEHLGGLIHRMPQTAFVFLVGCVAISALPPLNGFVSEWLTFQAILLSPDLPQWGLKFLVPAVGALLALSAALAAACFVKAFGVSFLGRAAQPPRPNGARGRPLLARRDVRAGRALPGRRHPARLRSSTRWRRSTARAGRRQHAAAGGAAWLSIVPIAESRSSYNGLLVFVFIAVSAWLAAFAIHGLASDACAARRPGIAAFPIRARRRNTPPSASPSRSAACSARWCSARARASRCRRRVDLQPARLTVDAARSGLGRALCAASRALVGFAADRLNGLQFLTIRRYLDAGVRGAGAAAAGAGDMAMIRDLAVQGAQMLLVLLLAPLLTGFVRKVKARLLRRRGPPLLQPYRDLAAAACARRWCWRKAPRGCSASPPTHLRRHLGGGRAGADLRAPA